MILVILAALIVAGGTGFYVVQGLRPPVPEAVAQIEAPRLRQVYVPARELASGTILTPVLLTRMEMTEPAISAQMVVADADGERTLVGSVARQVLPAGVPIARTAVVQPGDRGFLAAVLPKGMRAITIPISEVAGIGGLVLPGDRVDIILTYSIAGSIIDAERDIRASETVMTNIRVLALDQRLGPVMPDEKDGKVQTPPVATTATLEVSPGQAEIITLSQTLGALSLILNSVRDGGDDAAEAEDAIRPAAAGPGSRRSLGRSAEGLLPRRMTLDSDVTSLLRRQLAGEAGPTLAAGASPGDSPVPLTDRTTRVQVVRGVQSRAVRLGLETAGSDAGPTLSDPASAPAPTTE
jgi:pilus assembly protein CpaB